MDIDCRVYPHRLLELNAKEIEQIVINTLHFTFEVIEREYPDRLLELQRVISVQIPDKTIKEAFNVSQYFIDDFLHYIKVTFLADDTQYKRRITNAKKYYMKTLNADLALVFTHGGYIINTDYLSYMKANSISEGVVINIPLFEAIGETLVRKIDYYIIKDDYLRKHFKNYIETSNDTEDTYKIKRTINTKSKSSLNFYFIKVLSRYGSVERQIIDNFGMFNPQKHTKKLRDIKKSMNSLPPLYHKKFDTFPIDIDLSSSN